jgi:long-chain acyl-CoA synthetase
LAAHIFLIGHAQLSIACSQERTYYPNMNLVSAFAASARKHPEKNALYWGETQFTYHDLWSRSVLIARELQNRFGMKPGARVGLWLRNCPEFIPALFAILQCGAVVVPINNFLKPDEVNYILSDAGIDLLVTDAELAAHFPALNAVRPGLQLFQTSEMGPEFCNGEPVPLPDPKAHEPGVTESHLAVLIYTSGTTGRPKGAMLSHGNLLHNVDSCRIVLRTVEDDRIAVLLPLFHSYMLTVGVLLPLLVGGSIVLVKSIHPVRSALQELFHREATLLPGIPQFYRSMVQAPIEPPLPLRLCISGSAPLPGQVLREFEAKFQIPLIEGYGLSEASPVVTKNPLDGTRKPGSIGIPIPNVEVTIQDEAGRKLDSEQIGELCVRGGNVMVGYWNQPEETAKVMRDGWLLTGDIGYQDNDGYFFITDRKKDMLLVNGINVYPREIEEILYQFPGVKEAAVIGKPDVRKGEQPIAFIAANDGASLEEKLVQQFVRKKLADYKVPRKVVILSALPRNATGKILKTALRQVPISD